MPSSVPAPRLLVGLFIALAALPSSGQSPDAIFRFLASPAEVGNILRNGIAVDQKGFVWLAGSNRIIRHDGNRAQTFMLPAEDIDPQAACFVFGLTIGADGTVWGSSRRGVVRLLPDDDQLRFAFSRNEGIPDIKDELNVPVTDIALDGEGRLWFVAGPRLYYYDSVTGTVQKTRWGSTEEEADKVNFPLGLETSRDGTLWIVFRSGKIGRLPRDRDEFEFISTTDFIGVPKEVSGISALRVLDSHRILVATFDGLYEIDLEARSWSEVQSHSPAIRFREQHRLRDLIVARDGTYWLGTLRAGLIRLDPASGRSWSYRHDPLRSSSLPSDRVRSLFQGPNGAIWVGTASGYALLESTDPFSLVPYRPTTTDGLRTVRPGVTAQSTGRIWSIRDSGILSVYDPRTGVENELRDFAELSKPSASYFLLACDSHDNVWVASRSTGLLRFDDHDRKTVLPIDPEGKTGFRSRQIMALVVDSRDRILVCHDLGLERMDPATGTVETIAAPTLNLRDRMIARFFQPRGGDRIWGSTSNGQLFSIEDGAQDCRVHAIHPRVEGAPCPTVIHDLYRASNGETYLAATNGLFRWDPASGNCQLIPETRAETGSGAYGILVDEEETFWIPSPWRGLLRYDPRSREVVSYRPENVVGNLEYLGGQHTVTADGRVLIATHQGVLRFRPSDLPFPKPPLPPSVTAVRVMGDMRWDGRGEVDRNEIEIRSSNDLISIDFVSPNSRRSDEIIYSYRLPAISDRWISVGNRGSIEITQLPSGRFDFELKALSLANGKSATSEALVLVVNLPLWQRPLVRGLAVTVVLVLLIILIYIRLRRVGHHARSLQSEIEFRERSEAERRSLEEQLLHAMKLEAVGKLAGGVAHDFNNILTAVIGHAEMLKAGLAEDRQREDLDEDVDALLNASDRAVRLTKQLLTFSRRDQIAPELIDPGPVLDEMKSMLQRLIRADIKLEIRRDPDLGRILADPVQLEQIILNLVVNAVDAMPDGGLLEVEMAATHLSTEERKRTRLGTKGALRIRVIDNGRGMTDAVKRRIFEPYFTTKGVGEGSGLGLSTVHGIVRQMEGLISVRSTLGKGTTFEVLLPSPECSKVEASDRHLDLYNPSGRLVLVCEENTEVRALACRILEISGFRTKEASNPEMARKIIDKAEEVPEILITDLLFQDGDGAELAAALRKRIPGLQVLFLSGMKRESLDEALFLVDQTAFLGKPFEMQSLISAVRGLESRI